MPLSLAVRQDVGVGLPTNRRHCCTTKAQRVFEAHLEDDYVLGEHVLVRQHTQK